MTERAALVAEWDRLVAEWDRLYDETNRNATEKVRINAAIREYDRTHPTEDK